MPEEQAVVANQAPVANHVTPVAAEVYERQFATHTKTFGSTSSIAKAPR